MQLLSPPFFYFFLYFFLSKRRRCCKSLRLLDSAFTTYIFVGRERMVRTGVRQGKRGKIRNVPAVGRNFRKAAGNFIGEWRKRCTVRPSPVIFRLETIVRIRMDTEKTTGTTATASGHFESGCKHMQRAVTTDALVTLNKRDQRNRCHV